MIFKKIFRYMALSSGDFQKIFKDFHVPSLPQAITHLMKSLKNPEVSIEEVANIIELDPGLAIQILKVVNSAFVGLPQPIKSLKQAVSVLGLKKIESLAVSLGVIKVVRDPRYREFDLPAFWTDSLLRALLARELANEFSLEAEEVFLAALLQDIALPVLLTEWFDVYRRAYDAWRREGGRLSDCEVRVLSWHHAQAGAWLAKNWSLSEVIVCGIGLHIAEANELQNLSCKSPLFDLVALSARVPSVLDEEPDISPLRDLACALGWEWSLIQKASQRACTLFLDTATSFGLQVKAPLDLPQMLERIEDYAANEGAQTWRIGNRPGEGYQAQANSRVKRV